MRSFVAVKFVDSLEKDSWFENIPTNVDIAAYMQRKYNVSYCDTWRSPGLYNVGTKVTLVFESGNVVIHLVDFVF